MPQATPTILVTGATGMLGSHLLWHLLRQGKNCRATKRRGSSFEQTDRIFRFYNDRLSRYAQQLEWVEADVLNPASMRQAMQGIDTVYHCAAVVSFADNPAQLLVVNIEGTRNTLDAALATGIRRFCFVSSIAALDSSECKEIIDENCFGKEKTDSSPYSQSKLAAEQLARQAFERGLSGVVVNPGVILGYALPGNGTMQLFYAVERGLPIYTLGGSGFVGVLDVCRAMQLLTESDVHNESFVLVSENLSNRELLNLIADSLGVHRPWIHGSRPLLMTLATVMEFFGKITGKKALIDRGTARTALKRSYYSAEKIKTQFEFEFTAIKDCVEKICAPIREAKEKRSSFAWNI
ncbi:MAG: SDR family oxidoreductase [Prevotellaceae bacterium]|jgi:nucleoside-diphosphate-sugar epimerase|nr:SDR family oxidoreductase [Prevotellaceae bacterium]